MDLEKPVLIPAVQFSGRILVVDDLRDIRTLVGHYLKRCGLQVEYANNGLDAINKIQQAVSDNNEFDLIFMDIHMPVKDGITAAREIRALHYSCPLIALTAAHMKGDQDLYLKSGFNASLSKPIDQAQMLHILGEFLRQPVDAAKSEERRGAVQPTVESGNETSQLTPTDRTVLIAEDSPDALSALRQLLDMLGWSTITASNAKNALDLANRIHPQYALVDIHLPDADGYSLSRDLETLIPDIKIYICSGAEFDPSKTCNAIKGHLLKPIGLDQLQLVFTR